MNQQREQILRQWFAMWLSGHDTGIEEIFAPDCVYTESWGPQYTSAKAVKHWFEEWNTRGQVHIWQIKQFFHASDATAVEWYFANEMSDGRREIFDGVTVVQWSAEGKIARLTEYGCNCMHFDPYAHGHEPQFPSQQIPWF